MPLDGLVLWSIDQSPMFIGSASYPGKRSKLSSAESSSGPCCFCCPRGAPAARRHLRGIDRESVSRGRRDCPADGRPSGARRHGVGRCKSLRCRPLSRLFHRILNGHSVCTSIGENLLPREAACNRRASTRITTKTRESKRRRDRMSWMETKRQDRQPRPRSHRRFSCSTTTVS